MDHALTGPVTQSPVKARSVLGWNLFVLVSFSVFLVSFPIDREIPFWPHLNLAEIFALWFLFVTPIAVVMSFVKFVKYARSGRRRRLSKSLVLASTVLATLANLLVLFGLGAASL